MSQQGPTQNADTQGVNQATLIKQGSDYRTSSNNTALRESVQSLNEDELLPVQSDYLPMLSCGSISHSALEPHTLDDSLYNTKDIVLDDDDDEDDCNEPSEDDNVESYLARTLVYANEPATDHVDIAGIAVVLPSETDQKCAHHDDDDDDDVTSDNNSNNNTKLGPDASVQALNFAAEHRIFLQAFLDLLQERDRAAPELGMNDPNILKSGPLKKASHLMNGVWKVKYIEIRRGMFSYYENSTSNSANSNSQATLLLRKNIPLEASNCTCRPVKLHQKALNLTPTGAIFELRVPGQKRLWMATSRKERQAWIQAISAATVGGSLTRGDETAFGSTSSVSPSSPPNSLNNSYSMLRSNGINPKSPYKHDLKVYVKTQHNLQHAKTKAEYIHGLLDWYQKRSIQVPIKWIANKGTLNASSHDVGLVEANAFREENVELSMEQLWRDLQRDTVKINDELLEGDCGHGPEKIIGALACEILRVSHNDSHSDLTESQALAYARDVLLAGNRTRSGGDSYYCVNTLCKNDGLIVVVPSSAAVDPVRISVKQDDTQKSSRLVDQSGWIRSRSKLTMGWKKFFFVLSEGTLSYYEAAVPRPHRLRGQLLLADAKLSVRRRKPNKNSDKPNSQFVVSIQTKEGTMKDRLLLFNSEVRLIDWVYALECTIKAQSSVDSMRKLLRRRSSLSEDGHNNTTKPDSWSQAESATKDHATKLGFDPDFCQDRLSVHTRRTHFCAMVTISACTEYRICTIDPQGDDATDNWVTVKAVFLQNIRLTGGPNGRIARGEEVVRVSIASSQDLENIVLINTNNNNSSNTATATNTVEPPPDSPYRQVAKKTRMFTRFSTTSDESAAASPIVSPAVVTIKDGAVGSIPMEPLKTDNDKTTTLVQK